MVLFEVLATVRAHFCEIDGRVLGRMQGRVLEGMQIKRLIRVTLPSAFPSLKKIGAPFPWCPFCETSGFPISVGWLSRVRPMMPPFAVPEAFRREIPSPVFVSACFWPSRTDMRFRKPRKLGPCFTWTTDPWLLGPCPNS